MVAFIDDIHWAETAFLDLVEHVLDTASGAPIVLMATARHDLLETRPQWSERERASRVILEPLSDSASAQVVENLLGTVGLPQDVVAKIVAAAEGNPLFIEQMLSMLLDADVLRQEGGQWVRGSGNADIAVPPTIHALLEARLDNLGREERVSIEPASVIGVEFAQPAVESLSPEAIRPNLTQHLGALARKHFIDPAASRDKETIYRFHHHLVRDTVYNGLLKRTRATLHINFVKWADRINAERGRALEFQEILGYHLEQAHRYLSELGPLDEQGVAIGLDASDRLASAAKRAFARGDMNAAGNLFGRALQLCSGDDARRIELLPRLGETQMELGRYAQSRETLNQAAELAQENQNHVVRWGAHLMDMLVRRYSGDSDNWSEEALRMANDSLGPLEGARAHSALGTAWCLISMVHGVAGNYGKAAEASLRCVELARLSSAPQAVSRSSLGLATFALLGPTPVQQAIQDCERILSSGVTDRQVEGIITCTLAQLYAMDGDFARARALCSSGRTLLRDLGLSVDAAVSGADLVKVELLAGDLETAERELRADCAVLERLGETYYLSSMAALLAKVVRDQGADADAFELTKQSQAASAADDMDAQAMWRCVRAPILARMGDIAQATTLAREAVAYARQTEGLSLQADTLVELAVVMRLAGDHSAAASAAAEAVELYRLKGDRASEARWTQW